MRSGNSSGDWDTRAIWVGASALVVFLVALSSTCRGQCLEGLSDRLVDMTHDGEDGLFVLTLDAACLLRQVELVRLLETRVQLLTARGERADLRYASMVEATARGTTMLASYEAALSLSIRRAVDAEDRADAWYRSPYLWATVGFGVGLSTILALLLGLG